MREKKVSVILVCVQGLQRTAYNLYQSVAVTMQQLVNLIAQLISTSIYIAWMQCGRLNKWLFMRFV